MQSAKKIFSIIIRISISIILLIFLFSKIDRKSLLGIIKSADVGLLALAFLIFFLSYVLALFRWEMLLKGVKVHLSLKRVIISFAGGTFFNLFLPSTIGGDFVRSIDLALHTKRPREIVATVLLDRLSGYIGLSVLTVVALLFGWRLVQDTSVLLSVAIIIAILLGVLLVLFNKTLYAKINKLLHSPSAGKIRESLKNLHQEMHIFRHKKKIIFHNLLLSLMIQAMPSVSFYLIALSLGLKIKMIYFFIFLPIISAISLLPISIGGLGLRDATTIYFFAKVGVGKDLAFAMSLLGFAFIAICAAIGGLIYVLTISHRRLQYHQSPVL